MRRFLPFAALIGVALVLGCQDVGTGPDGLVPQFGGPHAEHGGGGGGAEPDPGTLFNRPGGFEVANGYTCDGGAAIIADDPTFGTVNFNQPRDDSHMHANVQLRDALPGDYDIFGNQELVCDLDPDDAFNIFVDFLLRPGHHTTVTVGTNGKGKARIGLDFGGVPTPLPKLNDPVSHAPGPHRLWVTLVGTSATNSGVVLRSTAIEVVIPDHVGHP